MSRPCGWPSPPSRTRPHAIQPKRAHPPSPSERARVCFPNLHSRSHARRWCSARSGGTRLFFQICLRSYDSYKPLCRTAQKKSRRAASRRPLHFSIFSISISISIGRKSAQKVHHLIIGTREKSAEMARSSGCPGSFALTPLWLEGHDDAPNATDPCTPIIT